MSWLRPTQGLVKLNKKVCLCDRRIQSLFLEIGDRVMVRNVGFKGTNKIADKWNEQVYVVGSQPNPDIPAYEVKPEIGRSPVKVLHRNLLLPIHVFQSEHQKQILPMSRQHQQ